MTYLDNIQQAQTKLILPFARKRLLLRTPLSVVESLNPQQYNLWQFDPTNYDSNDNDDYVYLTLFPDYTPEDTAIAETEYRNTFSRSAALSVSTKRLGFTASINQSLRVIYDIVNQISAIAKSTAFGVHSPIKIIDFCRADADGPGNVISHGETGTIRYGLINITQHPDFVRDVSGMEHCREPWDFRFTESKLSPN